jgi:uncharacterized protein YndB with AHSA1/START domain
MIASAADTVLEITRVFEVPPARVFAAWLDLEQFQAWIGPEGVDCEVQLLEPQVGGRYRLVMNTPERVIPVSGVFKSIGSVESRDGHVRGWTSALNKLDRHLCEGASR